MKNKTIRRPIILLVSVILLSILPAASLASSTLDSTAGLEPDIAIVIEENSPELVELVTFTEGQAPGYGSNGKFLAPIKTPDPNAKKIYFVEDLDNVRNDLSGSYVLMNNIDLADWGEWVPIGDRKEKAFSGNFDGQGYVIRNLQITNDTYQSIGLFGYITDAEIRNVGLEDTQINASSSNAGGICGYVNGYIYNCYNTGDISSSSNTGGIFGSGTICISNCYNIGDISSFSSAGGICGFLSGSISNCYNIGTILSSSSSSSDYYQYRFSYAGGICGYGSYGPIVNCYNTGNVSSSYSPGYSSISYAGGICGNGSNSITKSYNTGNVSATSSSTYSRSFAGGISGTCNSISNCVVLSSIIYAKGDFSSACSLIGSSTQKSNNLALDSIEGNPFNDSNGLITSEQATDKTTYENLSWDFDNIWKMDSVFVCPQLREVPAGDELKINPNPTLIIDSACVKYDLRSGGIVPSDGIVDVTYRIENNIFGFINFAIDLPYDSNIYTPISVTPGSVLFNYFLVVNPYYDTDTMRISYINGDEGIVGDCVLFTVKYKFSDSDRPWFYPGEYPLDANVVKAQHSHYSDGFVDLKWQVDPGTLITGIVGDVNGDGIVTPEDAMLILQMYVRLIDWTPRALLLCDMDGDGVIDITDATIILMMVVGG
ncbi:MAG: dockerin type I domain-containing protein [Clostridiales bacterium]|jgi:hypothetical protein|nr:dockerin type I domain-containing protein [Clostridiales bacterium]